MREENRPGTVKSGFSLPLPSSLQNPSKNTLSCLLQLRVQTNMAQEALPGLVPISLTYCHVPISKVTSHDTETLRLPCMHSVAPHLHMCSSCSLCLEPTSLTPQLHYLVFLRPLRLGCLPLSCCTQTRVPSPWVSHKAQTQLLSYLNT